VQLKTVYQSMQDATIEAEDSYSALQLAEANPSDPRFREWISVLKILDAPQAKPT
jgi:hypothetical protein